MKITKVKKTFNKIQDLKISIEHLYNSIVNIENFKRSKTSQFN